MKKIVGATAHINLDFDLIKGAGITAFRHGFGYPFKGADKTALNEGFKRSYARGLELNKNGFSLLGSTFGPGSYRFDEKAGKTVWVPSVPAEIGTYADDSFYDFVELATETLGRECKDMCEYWQVANEPDIDIFHGDMTFEQQCRFLTASAKGLIKGNPNAKPGINIGFMSKEAEKLIEAIYNTPDSPFYYLGVDGYMGSWQDGKEIANKNSGAEAWSEFIDRAVEVSKRPIIINEWGYSTLQSGPNPDPEGLRKYNQNVCKEKQWFHKWQGKDHSEQLQAEYIMIAMKIFAEHPAVIGEFFFRWSDTDTCWQCGDPLCPAECAWGVVDTKGKPKPGYYALKEAYEKYFK